MKIKRFFAKDMRQAIREIREELGADAVILSNRRVSGGIEIIASLDYDEAIFNHMNPRAEEQEAPVEKKYSTEKKSNVAATGPAHDTAKPASSNVARLVVDNKKPDVEWVEDPAIVAMRHEIQNLRGILENQLSHLTLDDFERKEPGKAVIARRLEQMGMSHDICQQLVSLLDNSGDQENLWNQALALIAHKIQVTDDDILSRGGVVALVGPTGVGKTTSIAKLAARFTLRHGNREVALISTDNYRIGAHEQLMNFGRIMGIPTYMAASVEDLTQRIQDLSDKRLILVDTSGMSQRDVRLNEQLQSLSSSSSAIRTYLVMAANTQTNTLNDVMRAFRHIPLAGTILTKLDETTSLGGCLSTVIRYALPVAYISDGQQVPEDMHPARAHTLVSRAVTLMQQEELMSEKYPTPGLFDRNTANAHV